MKYFVAVSNLPTSPKVGKLQDALTKWFLKYDFAPLGVALGKTGSRTSGMAIVSFASLDEAAKAQNNLNGKMLDKKHKLEIRMIPVKTTACEIDFEPRSAVWSFSIGGKPVSPNEAYAAYRKKDTRFAVSKTCFDSLPVEMKREISSYIPLLITSKSGVEVVDRHTTEAVSKPMRKRRKDANANLYNSIGLLRTNPELAIRRVKQGIRDADPNVVVPPWVSKPRTVSVYIEEEMGANVSHLERTNILLQVVLDKFRDDYESPAWDDIDLQAPLEERNAVDTARHEIIKVLLDNGANFDEVTVDAAMAMRDLATVTELALRNDRRDLSQRIDRAQFFDESALYLQEYQGQGKYTFQEINGTVEDTFDELMRVIDSEPQPFEIYPS